MEGLAHHAALRVAQARTLREVRDFGEVHVPGLVRSLAHGSAALRTLPAARARRATELVDAQLAQLTALVNKCLKEGKPEAAGEARRLFTKLNRDDWQFLRGEHATLFDRAVRHGQRELHRLPAVEPPTQPTT